MTLQRCLLLCATLVSSVAHGQRQYGFNHRDVVRDNDVVTRNFPDVDIDVRSPAFLTPETVPETFHEGTTGPTDEVTFGKCSSYSYSNTGRSR